MGEEKAYRDRDAVLLTLGFASYRKYLTSALWRRIRAAVLDRDVKCRLCENNASAQAHHYSYSRATMAGESIDEIIGVCRFCHRRMEFKDQGRGGGRKRNFFSVRHRTMKRLKKRELERLVGPRRLCGAFYSDPTLG